MMKQKIEIFKSFGLSMFVRYEKFQGYHEISKIRLSFKDDFFYLKYLIRMAIFS